MTKEKTYNYVYKITNNINGKFYYGVHSTNNLDDEYMGSGVLINKAIKKYGLENFSKEIILYFSTRTEAFQYESSIVTKELTENNMCYNVSTGGKGGSVYNISDETRKRLSDSHKGFHHSEETKQKISKNSGMHKPEVRAKLKGRKLSSDTIKKILDSKKDYKHSEETKQKISNANKGHIVSEETRNKLSKANKGNKHTDSTKDKISNSSIKMWDKRKEENWQFSDEARKKMSDAHKGKQTHSFELQQQINKKLSNLIWINNGLKSKRVYPNELDDYLNNGWKHGMLKHK